MEPTGGNLGYRPALDGMRAFAILAVVAYSRSTWNLAALLVTIAVAAVSYRWIEQPLRRRFTRPARPAAIIVVAGVT